MFSDRWDSLWCQYKLHYTLSFPDTMKLAHPLHSLQLSLMSTSSFSPYPTMNISSDILGKSQEEHMQLALATIQGSGTKANRDPNYSIHKAGKDFDIPQTSIACHLKGMLFSCCIFVFLSFCKGSKTCQEVHANEQLLTAVQEEIFVEPAPKVHSGRQHRCSTYS